VTRGLSAERLLKRPVLVRDIRLGQPTDVVLDAASLRAVGLAVHCGDEVLRFLPFPSATFADGSIRMRSALQLLDEPSLGFYRRRTISFRALRGLPVKREGRALGSLADVVLGPDGAATGLVVDGDDGRRHVVLDARITIGGRSAASAA
jgi:hypothetical protein